MVVAIRTKKPTEKLDAAEDQSPIVLEGISEYVSNKLKLKKEADKYAKKIKELSKKVNDFETTLLVKADELLTATQSSIFSENEDSVEVTSKGNATEITDLAKVAELLGDEVFMLLAKVNIGDLKDYLTPPQVKQVTKVTAKNKRRIKIS